MLFTMLVTFLIYWLLIFVVNYIMVDYGQRYLYDETTPSFGLKVLAGSFALALLATRLGASFDTMFTTRAHWTLLQALAWVGVFTLLYQFHPPHALGFGLACFVLVPGLATMTAESLTLRRTIAPVRTGLVGPYHAPLGAPKLPPAAPPARPGGVTPR